MADPVYPTADEKLAKLDTAVAEARYLYEHGAFSAMHQQDFFAKCLKAMSDEPTYPPDPPPEEPAP